MYKLFLSLHYLRTRIIAWFAVIAVALCVTMVLVVMSVMGGWLDMVKQRARGLLGDVIIDNHAYGGFPLYEEFIATISEWPEVARATPVLYTYALLRIESPYTEQTATVSLVGMRLDEAYEVNAFRDSLFYEKYYPGTTTFAEQHKPAAGFDRNPDNVVVTTSGRRMPAVVLPEPYQGALERARREHLQRTGRPLEPVDEVDSRLNRELREYGMPTLPGEYWFSDDERPQLHGDALPGVIIGRDIIAKREADGRYNRYYTRGTIAKLTYWAVSSRGQVDPIPKRASFRYTDDSRTGVFEIDSRTVYVEFDLLQRLLEMNAGERVDAEGEVIGTVPARCSQIQIKLSPEVRPSDLPALTARLKRTYHAFLDDPRFDLDTSERRLVQRIEAVTWEQSQAHIIGPVEKERMLVTILFGIVSLVAVALILCILYMIVLQKTREIGVTKSLGGSPLGVASVFVAYGAAVGLIGALLGTAAGAVIVWNINAIQDYLISIDPRMRVWDLSVYSFDRIPQEVNPFDATVVALLAVYASTLGSLAAARRAGAMEPVEALRYE